MIRMKNKTDQPENKLSFVMLKHDENESAAGLKFAAAAAEKPAVRYAAAAVTAFILTGTKFGGVHSPLCVPFAAVLSPGSTAAALAGILVSCIIGRSMGENFIEAAAALLISVIKLVKGESFSVRESTAVSAAVYFVCGLAASLLGGLSVMSAAAVLLRTGICAAAAYIFGRAHSIPANEKNVTDPVPIVLCYIIAVSALGNIKIGYICPGRIAACIATIIYAKKHGSGGGASAGTASACGLLLADGSFGRSAVLIACSGFASGLASYKGKLAVSLTYIFASLAFAVTVGLPSGITEFVVDSVAAGIIFFAVPEKIYMPVRDRLDRQERNSSRHTSAKLGFAADTINEISRNVADARRILMRKENEYDTAASVYNEICLQCARAEGCRLAESGSAGNCFAYAAKAVGSKNENYARGLPKSLDYCCRKAEVIKKLHSESIAGARRRNHVRTADVLSAAAAEQLSAQSLMLRSVADEFGARTDGRLSLIAEDALRSLGISVRSASVYYNRQGRAFCEFFTSADIGVLTSDAAARLGEIVGRTLDVPSVFVSDSMIRYRLCELPEFIVDTAVRSLASSGEPSGDSSEYFTDGFGKIYFVIADGMGSGLRAEEESCMAVSIINRLVRTGSGVEAAVRYANTILCGLSSDEIFTTLDIAELDTFTGKCRLFKLGAAESCLRIGGEVEVRESCSVPIGILSDIAVPCETVRLSAGDCAVMVSDGIGDDQREFICGLVMNDIITADICADKIISHSENSDCLHKDDKTVIVFKLYDY